MKRLSNPDLALVLVFLGILTVVPLTQATLELSRGERPEVLSIFKRKPTSSNLRRYEHNLEEASWVAARLRPWAQYAQFAWLKDGGEKSLIGRDGWLFYKPGVDYLTERPGTRSSTSTAADAVGAIIDFRNQLATRGIQLLVMPAPNKESVYPEKLTRRAEDLHLAMSSETAELLNRLKAADIEVVNLFELFAAEKSTAQASSRSLYLAQDTHWSPAGVELAARAVAERIRKRDWLKAGSVVYDLKPAPIQRLGDILRMLQVPKLESQAAAEIVPCNRVLHRDTLEPYQDDKSSEVLVLGDSFLRIYETDEPGASGFVAHLARYLKQPVTSIVNDGGASTLVRQELTRRSAWLAKKKLVIWEFVERDIRLGAEGWQHVPLPPEESRSSL